MHSIDERPDAEVSLGGDTVKGSTKSQLLTHVERMSLFTLAHKIPDGTADSVHAQMKKEPLLRDSVGTYDRGSEFALWQMIERDLNMKIYLQMHMYRIKEERMKIPMEGLEGCIQKVLILVPLLKRT